MSTPQDRGWGPGWPNCQEEKWVYLEVPGVKTSFGRVHQDIAELASLLIQESVKKGYVFKDGQCWGANCRPVRGSTTTPSNHSWGLALDFNSAYNYLGRTDGGDIPSWMVDLWAKYGFFWGGKYQYRKDPMHFEFVGTPTQAKEYLAEFKAMLDERIEDMRFQEFREGWEAYMAGKNVQARWSGDKRFGWRAARYAGSNPKTEGPVA